MLIKVCAEDRFDIGISSAELRRYSLDFDKLDAHSEAARRLLDDVLGVLKTMGVRREGENALVECDSAPDGCILHITIARQWFRFECAADVHAACRAGLGDLLCGRLVCDADGYILAADVPRERLGLLLEFCRRGSAVSNLR